jgi:prepilin-type N-terminal cleavage/methylation domain-containing protein
MAQSAATDGIYGNFIQYNKWHESGCKNERLQLEVALCAFTRSNPVSDAPTPPKTHRGGFTLIEIMIVVAIIALLAVIALPNFLRARRRAQATLVLDQLRVLSAAIDQYAIETNKTTGARISRKDLQAYLKKGTQLYNTGNDIFNARFQYYFPGAETAIGRAEVDSIPAVNATTFSLLSDVAPSDFWSPYFLAE